jgi:hypothetical protein
MVTNYPHHMTRSNRFTATHEAEWIGERLLSWVRQAFCGLHGHDHMLQFGQERMSLKCASCGHESSGWELNEARPTITARGDARHHRLARPQLVRARRIA